jgi:uncharacterized protein YjiS (DUF1127 family)
MRWVTQARPKIDRLASPWLISRFVDPQAQFLFVAAGDVCNTAAATGAIPFDVPVGTPDADLAHPPGGICFNVIRAKFRLDDPALERMATIVHAADNDNLFGRIPEAAGLRAISLGLARSVRDDQERLAYGLVLYDALYQWASRSGTTEDEVFARAPMLYQALATIGGWTMRFRERRALGELSDHLLRDVGLSREQAEHEAAKPWWRS